ncbi:transketolase [Micropruina glycogenica]|uniref:Transketolase n=1 Tax=Micropruina glycogenica TaxID=75385 RepID=A0A2N9JHM4_9ACTN|nr:transketolase [Micropruina glycogenica]SPD87584.1 Transketolase [Micropruina glycogenica]
MSNLTWSEQDAKAVDTARVLAADAVEKVGNGHPGTAISLAPIAYLLYAKVMNVDPNEPRWLGRDRFVMSAGHSSMTQYAQLYLNGFGLELNDIESLRTWGSLTPGHPEFGLTKGIECTTGPLGAGVANSVGFAMSARRSRELYDPQAAPGESVFDHNVFCIAGDGCMQEGVSGEASSMAATLDLGNLFLIYDDNRISIEGDTKIAFSEDVQARYDAYGWDTYHVDFTNGFTTYEEKVAELYDVIERAKQITDKPHFIKVTTIIGWPLPNKAGDHSVHGSKLGADEISGLKAELGFEDQPFAIDSELVDWVRANAVERAKELHAEWDPRYEAWRSASPEHAELLDRVLAKEAPADLDASLPVFEPGSMATRAASGKVLSALAQPVPELWGGSADLAGSNNTTMAGVNSFIPSDRSSHEFTGAPGGRTLHFGIREHAMGNIANGITMDGLTRVYCATFLVFSDYMRTTPRLAALSHAPTTFVWTHDSVGVGEDGPTHQPIEHVMSLRLMPNIDVVRPGDANETAWAWAQILRTWNKPAALILSRQNLPILDRSEDSGFAAASNTTMGGYVLKEASGDPQVVLVGTGSELQVAVKAAEALEADGIAARVVSMPCVEWFHAQSDDYQQQVLPADVPRVVVEAGVPVGWKDLLGANTEAVGIDHFGASADGALLFEKFGVTAEAAVEKAKALIG